jgi:hypothetical protein
VGGLLAPRIGEWTLSVIGFVLSGVAYWLISGWPADILAARHAVFGLDLPRMDTDLVIAGLGLGLVIAPLSSVMLRVVPSVQHGIASAAVVVARTMGMLIGVAALAAWGLHRFQEITADLVPPLPPAGPLTQEFANQIAVYQAAVQAAALSEYKEIFLVTAILCGVGAVISLALATPRSAER